MAKQSKREQREAERRRKRVRNLLLGGGAVLAVLIVIVLFVVKTPRAVQAMGDAVPVDSREHIPDGTDPGPYPTDPPAGGKHYAEPLPAGFYTEEEAAQVPNFQAGYLVHSLEHGYVIFWYNCAADPSVDCDQMKQTIQSVMDENKGLKMIAFPWKTSDKPLVITSWGRILRLDKPDAATMNAFYKANLNQSPEPNAD